MSLLRAAALPAFLLLSSPVLAHEGVLHEGCAYGQVFTAGDVTVTGAFIRAVPKGGQVAGAYLTITSSGGDTLLGATSAAASAVALHHMSMNGNVMQMSPVEGGLAIPAGGEVTLDTMHDHLMLTGMDQPFTEGACVQMVLHFAKAGDLPIELNIGGMGAKTAPSGPDSGASVMSSGEMDMSSMSMGM